MTRTETIARAINPGAWSLHDRMPEHREKDPYHASDLDMSWWQLPPSGSQRGGALRTPTPMT
jgi:hypothetical protein